MRTTRTGKLSLSDAEAAPLGRADATRVRTFRLILLLAQELRTAMDHRLRADGLTTQQAALTSVIDMMGSPSIGDAATTLGTTHQNVKQLAVAMQRKGLLRFAEDRSDRRIRRLVTTRKSRALWRRRSAADQQHVADWLSCLSASEIRTLFSLLLRVEQRMRDELARQKGDDHEL